MGRRQRDMTKRFLLLTLVLALFTVACGDDSTTDTGADDAADGADTGTDAINDDNLLDGDWILTSGTVADVAMALLDENPVTMTIDGDQISGRAACNQYGGTLTTDGTSFTAGGLWSTEMGCEPEVLGLEIQFLEGIQGVTTADRNGDVLTVTGGGATLTFAIVQPDPPAELTDTTWVLDTILPPDAASSTINGAEPATLILAADGTFSGHTGCRPIAGEYALTGSLLQFSSWAAEGDCTTDFVSQDDSVVSVLDDDLEVTIDGNRLTLTASGGEGLSYQASQ